MPLRRSRTLARSLAPLLLALLVVVQPGLAAVLAASGGGCSSACCCAEPAADAGDRHAAADEEPAACCAAPRPAPAPPHAPVALPAGDAGCTCMAAPDGRAPRPDAAAADEAGAGARQRLRLACALERAAGTPAAGAPPRWLQADPAPPPAQRAHAAREPHDLARRLLARGLAAALALHGISRR